LADACRTEHARRAAAGYATTGGYATSAHLAELALAIVARADTDSAGRQQLLADLEAERTWTPDLRPPGIWDRHRLPRRMLRRLNPVWWYRRAHAAVTLGMPCGPYDNPDYQQITFVMDGHDVGRLVYQVCHVCRTGHVANISVDEPYQDRGSASRGLAALRAATPDYRWTTSSQRRDARTFWQLTGRRSRAGYRAAGVCKHIGRHTLRPHSGGEP
jgi:hypothetical protein